MAAVMNFHKLSDLKQHKFVLLLFWRVEVLEVRSPTRLKSRCPQDCVPSRGSRGESVSLPFPLLEVSTFLGLWPLPAITLL